MVIAVLGARLLLVVCFGAAALGKLADRDGFRRSLSGFDVPARLARPVAVLLPAAELAIALSLLPVATARWGALAATALLALFCLAIVRALARGEAPDCNCFGSLGSARVGRGTLVRNAGFMVLAVFTAVAGREGGGMSAIAWIGGNGVVVGMVAIALVTLLHVAFSWQLFKQNGRLLDRISTLEAPEASGSGGSGGLEIGELTPPFELPDLDGHRVTLDDLLARGRGVLLVFSDPACGHCDPLLPLIAAVQQSADGTPIALISTGRERENRAKSREHGLAQVLLQERFEVAESYRVYGSPGGVLLDPAGRVAAERASGARAVEDLIAAVALPSGGALATASETYAMVVSA